MAVNIFVYELYKSFGSHCLHFTLIFSTNIYEKAQYLGKLKSVHVSSSLKCIILLYDGNFTPYEAIHCHSFIIEYSFFQKL